MAIPESKTSRGIRDWYRQSRSGTRGEFLTDLQSLDCESLIALLNREISLAPRGRLRTKSELLKLLRSECPPIQVLQERKPVEQTLQWLFLHRNHLVSANESILWRELPTCCAGETVEGRADLLAFDQTLAQPILIELKDGDADDPLSGALLELLYHWAFYQQHVKHFHSLLAEFGCVPACPCRLVLVAPESYYAIAKARSPRRNNEYEWAMGWIGGLSRAKLVSIDLYAIERDWLAAGAGFYIGKLRQS